jgi:hypothetical protein
MRTARTPSVMVAKARPGLPPSASPSIGSKPARTKEVQSAADIGPARQSTMIRTAPCSSLCSPIRHFPIIPPQTLQGSDAPGHQNNV